LSARKARQHVKILPDSSEKDPKDTSDRVFNKLAWGLFYGTEGVQGSKLRRVYLKALLLLKVNKRLWNENSIGQAVGHSSTNGSDHEDYLEAEDEDANLFWNE
jgi:hypothetical protein